MAKFRNGNLILQSTQTIVQGSETVLDNTKGGTFSKLKLDSDVSVIIDEFSDDTLLASDSTTALVTEHAIKTYVDAASLAGTSGTSGSSGSSGTSGSDLIYSYEVDASKSDQGAAGGGGGYTLYDIATLVGTSKSATAHFSHNPADGNTTTYTWDTSENLTTYPNLYLNIDPGVRFARTDGDEVLTVYNPDNLIMQANQMLTAVDMLAFVNSGEICIELWGGSPSSSAAVNTNAIQYAIDSMTAPVINLQSGEYTGRIVSDSVLQKVVIRGLGSEITTWKNTDNTGKAIYFDTGGYCELSGITIDLNSTTVTGVDIKDSYFFRLYDLIFKNQAGSTSSAYALYMHGSCTHSSLEKLRFMDGNHGHLRVDTCNYSTFNDIRTGYSGTDATFSASLFLYSIVGSTFKDVYIEQGQFAAAYILSCQNLIFYNFQFESANSGPVITGGPANIYVQYGRSIHFYGGKFFQYGSASAYIVYFGDTEDLSFDGMLMDRQVTSSAKMVWSGGTTNRNITFKNIEVSSYDSTAAAPATFISSGATTLTDMVLENIWDYSNSGLTYDLHGERAVARNLAGTVIVDADTSGTSTIENCDTVNVESGQTVAYRRKGDGYSFDIMQKEFVASLSGATTDVAIQVNSNSLIIGVLGNVQTAITGCTSWNADFNTGSAVAIGTGYGISQNSKLNVLFDQSTLDMRTVDSTNITVTAVGGAASFSGGSIRFVVMYINQSSLPNA